MKISYKKPITEKTAPELSVSIEKAKDNIRCTQLVGKIVSPVCALLLMLLIPSVGIAILNNSGKLGTFSKSFEQPTLAAFRDKVLALTKSISGTAVKADIICVAAAILIPVIAGLLLSVILKLALRKKPVSPLAGNSDKLAGAKLLATQAAELTAKKLQAPPAIWTKLPIITSALSAVAAVYYSGVLKESTADKTETLIALLVGLVIFLILSWAISTASSYLLSLVCGFKLKYDTHSLVADIREYRLSLDLRSIIAEAIKNDSFYLNYQPICELKTGRYPVAEALVRLDNGTYGQISAYTMITAAEETGQICGITDLVVKKVCKFLSSNDAEALGIKNMHINLSALDCVSEQRIREIISIVDSYAVPHKAVCFEITESAAVSSSDNFWTSIRLLAANGFTVAMDDFGTGYSSLSRILDDAFSVVKIDRTLVADNSDKNKKTLLVDVAAMLSHLDKGTVLEGVETEAQRNFAKELGIDLIQGYYYSKPLSEQDYISFLKKNNGFGA